MAERQQPEFVVEYDEVIPGKLQIPKIRYTNPEKEASHQAWNRRRRELESEFSQAYWQYTREEFPGNLAFIKENQGNLEDEYPNEWVIVKDQKVVIHTPSIDTLLQELQKVGIKPRCYEILFTGDDETIFTIEHYLSPMTSRHI